MTLQERGVAHTGLGHTQRQREEVRYPATCDLLLVSFQTHLPSFEDLVAELLIGFASHQLEFIFTSENPVFPLGAVVEHDWPTNQEKLCSSSSLRVRRWTHFICVRVFACPSTATQAPLATRKTPIIWIKKLQTAATTKENARRRSFTPMLSSLDDAQPSTVMRVMRAQREVSLSLALSLKTQTMFSSRASIICI